MDEKIQAVRTIKRLKNAQDEAGRLQGWREIREGQNLSGEYVLSAKLNGAAYTEEEARMVAELFGR
ncbi:MAG: hypothetical protein Q3966_04015 [Neisseria sp.]|nr:hypothetical protein [Neisseria sp.]